MQLYAMQPVNEKRFGLMLLWIDVRQKDINRIKWKNVLKNMKN